MIQQFVNKQLIAWMGSLTATLICNSIGCCDTLELIALVMQAGDNVN